MDPTTAKRMMHGWLPLLLEVEAIEGETIDPDTTDEMFLDIYMAIVDRPLDTAVPVLSQVLLALINQRENRQRKKEPCGKVVSLTDYRKST